MPAVQLSQLSKQIELLLLKWEQPDLFLSQLKDMLEYYSDRLYQPAEQTPIQPGLSIYRVPAIVLRQMELAFTLKAAKEPEAALSIAEALWKHGFAETYELSAAILGILPSSYHLYNMKRIGLWAAEDLPASHLGKMIDLATRQIRIHSLADWQAQLATWLQSNHKDQQNVGLLGLLSLARDQKYQNLPYIFRNLLPLVENPPEYLVTDILDILETLAHRSPMETAFFIRQCVHSSTSAATYRLLRRALPALPPSNREALSPLLRDPDSRQNS